MPPKIKDGIIEALNLLRSRLGAFFLRFRQIITILYTKVQMFTKNNKEV